MNPAGPVIASCPPPVTISRFECALIGGVNAADHVFQAWHVQRAMWATFLAPRWNAVQQSPYAVSGVGLGAFSRCCPGPGGNFVPSGVYPGGASLLWGGLGLAAGVYAGLALME